MLPSRPCCDGKTEDITLSDEFVDCMSDHGTSAIMYIQCTHVS